LVLKRKLPGEERFLTKRAINVQFTQEGGRPRDNWATERESRMTIGDGSIRTLHGVTRAFLALVAAEVLYKVAIRSHVRRAIGIPAGAQRS
jgi:hypothetical protein